MSRKPTFGKDTNVSMFGFWLVLQTWTHCETGTGQHLANRGLRSCLVLDTPILYLSRRFPPADDGAIFHHHRGERLSPTVIHFTMPVVTSPPALCASWGDCRQEYTQIKRLCGRCGLSVACFKSLAGLGGSLSDCIRAPESLAVKRTKFNSLTIGRSFLKIIPDRREQVTSAGATDH